MRGNKVYFAQQLLFADNCQNCPHQFTNLTFSVTPTLMEVNDDGAQVYCLAVSGNCDAPAVHAEMTAGEPTWTLTSNVAFANDNDTGDLPVLTQRGSETKISDDNKSHTARWGYEITLPKPPESSESKPFKITFNANVTATIRDANNVITHTYNGAISANTTISYNPTDVTPKPCTDICEAIECDECLSDSNPGATCPVGSSSSNGALGGQGEMIVATNSNIREQNFTHNQGQAEATLDYIIDDQESAALGIDLNFRQDNKFGNGVRFIRTADKKKIIVTKKPKFITVELLQYGPIRFKEPKRIVYDASDAQPNKSYRFTVPLFLPELQTGI
ncbi:MAG: hypothetical protein LBB88_09530 [Planctomycetaceae bacterium]|jgi:hypothetical protein|nr:hypothetical protein [Planctomycetaceae bacterium]